jgi:hypothetical protein
VLRVASWIDRRRAAVVAVLVASGSLGAGSAAGVPAPDSPCATRPPPASAATALSADTTQLGTIILRFYGAQGTAVAFYECEGSRARALGERTAQGAETVLAPAASWRCDRLTRRFAAVATLPDGSLAHGSYNVRTTSCAHRFELVAAARLARPQRARVRVIDDWGIGGIRTTLCVTSPQQRRACRSLPFAPNAKVATHRFRATTRGRWRVELIVAHHRIRTSIAVGVRGRVSKPLTVLATGDSTMQGTDSFLADDLGADAKVSSDVRPGFSISSADLWTAVARTQVARLHQRATVISIGANEGFPMVAADGVKYPCCDRPWVDEYARRLRPAMRVYRRSGRLLWLTLPAPRHRFRVPIFHAINVAIMEAAHAVGGVRVLRMDVLFSPHGYRSVMRYRGRDVRVREPDGIHLNVAGTEIAARVVAKALRGR